MLKTEAVEKVAELARLKLSPNEAERFQKELGTILEFVEQLKALDVGSILPTTSISGVVNVAREDEMAAQVNWTSLSPRLRRVGAGAPEGREQLLKQAPERKGDFVKVKAILGEKIENRK